MNALCLTLLAPTEIDEKLLDALLMYCGDRVFTSAAAAAHGLQHEHMTDVERVRGRVRATQVQVVIGVGEKDALLAKLRTQFAGTGLRYWVSPISESDGPL
jgi:hypothetical protein